VLYCVQLAYCMEKSVTVVESARRKGASYDAVVIDYDLELRPTHL
jgi:hypothetical protein